MKNNFQMDKIKILIVDDMPVISQLIASLLAELNEDFEFFTAINGRLACKMALEKMPDLIIMDWEMPEMSGYEALVKIKRHEHIKDIPIIMASGLTSTDNMKMALEAGAIDYIRKPVDPIELIARVRSVLTLASTFRMLREKSEQLAYEKQRAESILRGYLPQQLVDEIVDHGFAKPKRYKNVTVLFTDLVDFTSNTNLMSAKRMFGELNDIFTAFDHIVQFYDCTKIKTIGDAYVAASGLPNEDPLHAFKMTRVALDMQSYIQYRNRISPVKWEIRMGLSSGDVFGGLIGRKYFQFDIFGDTINTSARMQQHSNPMHINISADTYELIKDQFKTIERVPIHIKGKGIKKMYYVHYELGKDSNLQPFEHHPLFKSCF